MRRGPNAGELEAKVRRAVPGEAEWLFVAGGPALRRAVAASELAGTHYVTYLELYDPDDPPAEVPEAAFGVPPTEAGVVVRYQKAYRNDPFLAGMEFQRILGPLVDAEKEAAGDEVPFGQAAVERVVRAGQKRALMERLHELAPDATGEPLEDDDAYREEIVARLRELVGEGEAAEEELEFLESFHRFKADLPTDDADEGGQKEEG